MLKLLFLTTLFWSASAQSFDEDILYTITHQDYSNSEFLSSENHPVAKIRIKNSPVKRRKHQNIVGWLGASQGDGWQDSRKQSFRLIGLEPGFVYRLKIKFYAIGNSPTFVARHNGERISRIKVDKSNMNDFWEIEFTASRPKERIHIVHQHQPHERRYALIDYIQVTELY